ncbi:DUF4129 domain-containing protein [Haloarcula halophila]|uniref:DUF4129 domain-containing protein n=1 Tax=Haloarcula TaxID=2237 RepID=UPI0023E38B8F|nr:DUF4129 domain-containing protein [Halomicroarcula sp. DFY41]
MRRQTLLVAVVAAVALLSFSVGAASLDASTGEDRVDPQMDDREIDNPGADYSGPEDPSDASPPAEDGGARSLIPTLSSPALGALVAAFAVVVVAVWRFAGGGESPDDGTEKAFVTPGESTDTPTYSTDSIDVPLSNDVYRAWADLTERLGPADGATTPREYARRLAGASEDPAALDRLRETFERVRYGGEQPTAELERTAREALEQATVGPEDER